MQQWSIVRLTNNLVICSLSSLHPFPPSYHVFLQWFANRRSVAPLLPRRKPKTGNLRPSSPVAPPSQPPSKTINTSNSSTSSSNKFWTNRQFSLKCARPSPSLPTTCYRWSLELGCSSKCALCWTFILIDLYTDMNVDFSVKFVLFTIQSRFIWRVGFTASYDIVPMSDCLIETLYGALPQETDIVTPIFLWKSQDWIKLHEVSSTRKCSLKKWTEKLSTKGERYVIMSWVISRFQLSCYTTNLSVVTHARVYHFSEMQWKEFWRHDCVS